MVARQGLYRLLWFELISLLRTRKLNGSLLCLLSIAFHPSKRKRNTYSGQGFLELNCRLFFYVMLSVSELTKSKVCERLLIP